MWRIACSVLYLIFMSSADLVKCESKLSLGPNVVLTLDNETGGTVANVSDIMLPSIESVQTMLVNLEKQSLAMETQLNNRKGRNMVENGAFQVWQRCIADGNCIFSSNEYFADRWSLQIDTGFTATTTFVDESLENTRTPKTFASTSIAGTGTGILALKHTISGVTTCEGVACILQFKARSSVANTVIGIKMYRYFGTDGNVTSPVMELVEVPITTDWEIYTHQFILPEVGNYMVDELHQEYSTKDIHGLDILFCLGYNGVIDNGAAIIDITDVQLEYGSFATQFEKESYADTLWKCKKWYDTSYSPNEFVYETYLLPAASAAQLNRQALHFTRPMVQIPLVVVTVVQNSGGASATTYTVTNKFTVVSFSGGENAYVYFQFTADADKVRTHLI